MPNPFRIATSRHEFFVQLEAAIAKTQQLIAQKPTWELLQSVARQLEAMKAWTHSGRKPTFDERKSITMGRKAYREIHDTNDSEWQDYMDLITDLALYFKYWRSDAGLQTLDSNDWRTDFPERHDLSDE
jgi:hypothetical protein